jgi:hypothetical protein
MSAKSSERHNRPATGSTQAKERAVWLGFVDIALSDEQRAFVSEMNFTEESAFSFLEELTDEGYKVSFTADTAHKSFITTATGSNPDCLNKGYSLSGRGPTLIGSLASLAFKHVTICDRGIWSNAAGSTAKSSWG